MLPTANRGSQEFSEFIFVEFSIYSFFQKKKNIWEHFYNQKKNEKAKREEIKKGRNTGY
jgi:hypothetical protein